MDAITDAVREEAIKILDALVSSVAGQSFKCSQEIDGKACTLQHEGVDRNGRLKFYFETGCKVVETFCPACLAYWHLAVARNALAEYLRRAAWDRAELEAAKVASDRNMDAAQGGY